MSGWLYRATRRYSTVSSPFRYRTQNIKDMDIRLFREGQPGGNPDLVRESQRRRGKPIETVDEVIALDAEWKSLRYKADQCRQAAKAAGNEINVIKKKDKKADVSELIAKAKELRTETEEVLKKVAEKETERDLKLNAIGNLVHDSVPVSNDEEDNELVRTWGECREKTDDLHHHHHLLSMIDGYCPEAGSAIAGRRGYFLKGFGMLLNQALIQYGLKFLGERGYTPLQTPFFMNKDAMGKVAALSEFHEALYKVVGHETDEEKYLIATSEQPCCALHSKDIFNEKDLPVKYAAYSTCFRKEAGSYGKDAWGIYRIHQFEKIEQFCLCSPEKSWELHEDMIKVAEEFYQSLELPYRIVTIVSGELNNAAAKKYDLEAWFPTLGIYRELVSCSNCTDYQSRRMEIRYGTAKNDFGAQPYVHLLNSTLTATERTICCILENYQTENGVRIPEVLKPYFAPYVSKLDNPEIIPFTKEKPKEGKGAKGKGKKKY